MTKKIISSEDRDLFRQSLAGIRLLMTDKVLLKQTEPPKPVPKPKPRTDEDFLPLIDAALEPVGAEEALSYGKPGVAKNVLSKLRQGYFGLDAELDLHGLTSTQAQRQLWHFVATSRQKNYRCLRIVHGKGYRSAGNQPVLKNHVNSWLRQHWDVLAFCSACPKDGGTGAVWVLLRIH